MPALRTIISLPAGMARMPLPKFFVWTFAGSAIWNSMLAGAGLLLGSRFHELDRYVGPFAIATTAVMVLAYIYRVVTWKPRSD
jgi:membrane protein DedA with SNARE-associated domain